MKVRCIPEPQQPDRSLGRPGESLAQFLGRSTLPASTTIRRFINGNIAGLPSSCAQPICRSIHSERFHEANLELIVGRTLQVLGAKRLRYELVQPTGRRPDFLATFDDGRVFVDATHPDWNSEVTREHRKDERLIAVIEEVIPAGWCYIVHQLPDVGLADSTKPFRAAIEAAFAPLPPLIAGTQVVASADMSLHFHLELIARPSRGRAWLAGPARAVWDSAETRIRDAVRKKRRQLRSLAHPVIVAIGGALGAGLDDYEIALFGRSFERLNESRVVVERGFDRTGLFASASTKPSTLAGVLVYVGMDLTTGRDPVLFLHPRFRGKLPQAVLRLQVRTLTESGPHVAAATAHGIFSRLSKSSSGS